MPIQTAYDSLTNISGSPFGFKNRIINGAMVIDQRNAGASVTYQTQNSLYITDRFQVMLFGTTYSNPVLTAQQVTDAPSGFTNSIKVTSSSTITADANKLGCWIQQNIEGFNIADFAWGTAFASPITLSFRIKASKTGTVSVSLENAATDRSYLTTVSISAANTWETKTVTIPGDTSGTWVTNNGMGVSLKIGVYSNGSWLAGAGGTSWLAGRAVISTSQTNFIAASGDNIAITGVQLEKGSTATPFDYRDYGRELILCQRYYEAVDIGSNTLLAVFSNAGAFWGAGIKFAVTKRAAPSMPNVTSGSGYWVFPGGSVFSAGTTNTLVPVNPTADYFGYYQVRNAGNSTPTAGNAYMLEATVKFTASSEI